MSHLRSTLMSLLLWATCLVVPGSLPAQLQLPAIDPSGSRVFLPAPNSTTLLLPGATRGGLLGHHRQPVVPPPVAQPPAAPGGHGSWMSGLFHRNQAPSTHSAPARPAFTHPADAAPCSGCGKPGCNGSTCRAAGPRQHIIPKPSLPQNQGQLGQILMTPHRIVAPVGAEVVVLAGLCGGDGYFVKNQPLEWMLSNDSVGQIIEVGGMEHEVFNKVVQPTSRKFDGQYAHGRTGLKPKLLTRGTPSPGDDIDVLEGQTYISLHSASPGTTWLTAVAPDATAWDRRRATTVIHWIDGIWAIPAPVTASSGTVQPLTTTVSRVVDGGGLPGWKVRYTIVGGTPAEFAPTGSQTADVESNQDGQATVQVRQKAGKVEPGTTQVRVDVIRPAVSGEPELVVESGLTGIIWSAPALTLRAVGPRAAGINEPYNYRIEVSNPGDQLARDVVVSTEDLGEAVQFVSSEPKPSVYGKRYEWRLGDLPPGTQPLPINIQLRSDQRGLKRACFRVASASDRLETEACAETEVAAPCLGVRLNGPTSARINDDLTFEIELVNQCNENLENVRIAVQYDAGLTATGLGNPIEANVGTLRFGEKKTLPLQFRAVNDGVQCFALNVVADGGHTASGRRCVEISSVVTGQVEVRVEGPQMVEQGQVFLVNATVVNSGNVPLENVVLNNRFARTLTPRDVTTGYSVKWIGEELGIFIGNLAPGQSVPLQVRYQALDADPNAFTQFTASTPSGAQSQPQNYPIRIGLASGAPLPGSSPGNPGGSPGAAQPGANEGGIRIPADPRGGLAVSAATIDPEIVADSRTTARVRFAVTNNRTTMDQNVKVMLVAPPGLRLLRLSNPQGQPVPATVSSDQTRYTLETIKTLRPAESVAFEAELAASLAGQYTLEFLATSDNTLGEVSGTTGLRVVPTR